MSVDAAAEHLAHARELARRDEELARELERIREVAARASAIRARAREIQERVERIPVELAELEALRDETELEISRARRALEAAEARLAALEAARRPKADEIDRVRSEAETARDELADFKARLERLAATEAELRSEELGLREAAEELSRVAARVADDIRGVARAAETARTGPGETLAEIEEWGARVRSALFVARGTLELERDRIVTEANALGTAVLDESLGVSSVAVVLRRLEARLGGAEADG